MNIYYNLRVHGLSHALLKQASHETPSLLSPNSFSFTQIAFDGKQTSHSVIGSLVMEG